MGRKKIAVIGLGAMGSATAFALAEAGADVTGYEQFGKLHNKGSYHGETRAIRAAYFEGSHYVALVREAFTRWEALQKLCPAVKLYDWVGALEAGVRDGVLVHGVMRSVRDPKNKLADPTITIEDTRRRFPQFELPNNWDFVFETEAGFLRPEPIVDAYMRLASAKGVKTRYGEAVTAIDPYEGRVMVKTASGSDEFDAAVITAGQWHKTLLAELLPCVASRLYLTRQVLAWFKPQHFDQFDVSKFPVFALEVEPRQIYYGFPAISEKGVKIASHSHGRRFEIPGEIDRVVTDSDKDELAQFAETHIPRLGGNIVDTAVCTYTNSDDEDFFIGLHPDHHNVVIASPCSGHGFKFASIFGEILAELALKEETRFGDLIHAFRFDRPRKTEVG